MADTTTSMVTSITMIVLFTIAIIGFSLGFANDNNAAVRLDDSSRLNNLYNDSKNSINQFSGETSNTYSSIVNTTIEPGSDVIKSPGAFTFTWGNIYGTFKGIISFINVELFGNNPALAIFMTAFVTIIGFLFTMYIIKAWRGNP